MDLQPARPEDLAAVCELHNRSEAFDGVPRVLELEELREELDGEGVVLDTDMRFVELDGEPRGYLYSLYLPSETVHERCYLFGEVDPAYRGRGIGRALMAWGIERATAQLYSSGRDLPKLIRVDTYDYIPSAVRLFTRFGFEPVRVFEEMLRPLTDLPERREPLGIAILPWPFGRDDELRELKNEAFADHWGSTPSSPASWEQHVHGFGARTDLSFVAQERDSGRTVGLCLNHRYEADDELLGRRDGWISTLGTLAAWRGRGVASALVAASLHAFAGAGLSHASIGVDSDSLTGAAGLYRALGFEVQQRSITYEIRV